MKKLSLLAMLTLSVVGMTEIVQAKKDLCTYTKKSICNRHNCHWSHKKCRKGKLKKIKAAPATPIAAQGPNDSTAIIGASVQNFLPATVSVTFFDAQGASVSTMPLKANAIIPVPSNAAKVQVIDSDDFDGPQTASQVMMSKIAYAIGVDDNNNLAIGVISTPGLDSASTSFTNTDNANDDNDDNSDDQL